MPPDAQYSCFVTRWFEINLCIIYHGAQHGQFSKAVKMLIAAGQYTRALEMCIEQDVTISEVRREQRVPWIMSSGNQASYN